MLLSTIQTVPTERSQRMGIRKHSRKFSAALFSVMTCVMAMILSATTSAQQATKRTIVHAGKLLDVKTGKVLTNQAIVIEGGKIASIVAAAEIKASPGD